MAWAAIAVGVGTAVVGGINARKANKANAKAAKEAGKVDITTTQDPWAPSVGHRTDLMNMSMDRLKNQSWANTQAARGGGGGGGGKGGGNWWDKFQGAGPETERLLKDLRERGETGHELYDPANQFTKKLLAGEDPNAYRSETFGAYRDFNDPDLERYKEMLFSGQMPGTAGGGGGRGGGGGGYRSSYGGGGGEIGKGPIGIEKYIKDILDEKYLNQANPSLAGMIDASTADINRAYMQEEIPGITSQMVGAGRLGSGAWANALAQSEGRRGEELGQAITGLRYGEREARMADIMGALGEGNQYDMNYINAQAQANAAASAAGASGYAADKESQDRMALARMEALGGAIGMGVDMRKFGLTGMGGMADLYGRDQMMALGMVPELSGLDLRDLSTGAELSIGADQNRTQMGLGMAGLKNQRGIANAGLNWQREMYNREEPWKRQMRTADIINSMSGGYGSTHQVGTDFRGQSAPQQGPNEWAAAAQGGLAGWYGMQGYGGGQQDFSGYRAQQAPPEYLPPVAR